MKKNNCVVTGGNAGIGKAIALALVQMGNDLTIVSRNRIHVPGSVFEHYPPACSCANPVILENTVDSGMNAAVQFEKLRYGAL
jgi:NAD(P)-dependent dehydrogenase (short-subunit alcohol dehydrogenase family)